MASYLDTSFLLKLYVTEPDSISASMWLQQNSGRCIVSSLSDVEVATSLFRKHSRSYAEEAHGAYLEDRRLQIYQFLPIPAETFELAVRLAEPYSHEFRLRSLDILHQATALQCGADEFGTFDGRLAEAAKAAGLQVVP